MNKIVRYLLIAVLLTVVLSTFANYSGKTDYPMSTSIEDILGEPDSLAPRFPVKKTHETNYEDFKVSPPIDLKDPSNVQSTIEYDPHTHMYIFKTKVGDRVISTPFSMSADEYMHHTLKQSMAEYFKNRNRKMAQGEEDESDFSLRNLNLKIGPAERIFGPGGIKFSASGYVEGRMGLKMTKDGNPTRSERTRKRTAFDFDEDIQLNVTATVGDKINFDMNYDTEAMFDFDSKRLRLAYDASAAGDEDGILRKIEAGNVSMATTNSLIRGGTALFGITSELQFGRLRINTVISQQEAEARSVRTDNRGTQRTEFEFKADQYDENRHFFLSHYFRNTYDKAMSKLPLILSGVNITKLEVWVTNKRKGYGQSRNIVAFADLGEVNDIKNNQWRASTSALQPQNASNNLYSTISSSYSGIRDISQVTSLLGSVPLDDGLDYEKLEKARLLSESEYYFNPKLGYLSLVSALQADEVLAVAFSYTMNGKTYKVGELSSDISDGSEQDNEKSGALIVKLLKPTSLSPSSYSWDLMMKNVYNLGTTNIQQEDFRLQITYRSDTVGSDVSYLPEGNVKNKPLIRVMGLDRLNAREQTHPDGIFDFVEGYTVRAQTGRIYFPVIEPFGKNLRDSIGNNAIAEKYVYQELYDMTATAARQVAEKNKYTLKGSYRGSSTDNIISMESGNIPPGSVRVSAGGRQLVENVDYTVDYMSGDVNIINQEIMDSGTPIDITSEGRSVTMQRKTLMGINLSYDFSKDFNIGGTLMHYYERPLSLKETIGNESVKNTLWGLNASYRTQSMWLTNLVDKIPFVNATAPSQFNINAEFAHMIGGHYQNKEKGGGYSYLDDFETSEARIDIKSPYAWSLSSTPTGTFTEGKLSNNIDYGKNRARMAWFTIDPLFTRRNSSLTPQHIKYDEDQLSNHYVREILLRELFPYRDVAYNETATLPTLNLSYYPEERGPYNLDATNITTEGKLQNPEKRWAGITRKMEVRDFETSNIEYIEFWLMDPFVYDTIPSAQKEEGKLYFNLGDISEDVLKDGKKFYENGLPITGAIDEVETTVWGKVPKRQATVYAFDDNTSASRRIQDVGLNGLSTEEEFTFPTYQKYLNEFKSKLSSDALNRLLADPFSPLNDPAGDTYHFYRGSDYDNEERSILDRYKYYNNTEGNSPATRDTDEKYSSASRSTPDVEDIDQDNTLNEKESYYQYEIDINPDAMQVGQNYIVDKRDVKVQLRNGKPGEVSWYQFKIPIREHDGKPVGNIRDFKSIRFIRMFLTGFREETFLRFGTLQLVRGDWRVYEQALNETNQKGNGTLDVSSVNIEENADRVPVSYVLPPGLSRDLDPDQAQITKENERSMSMRVNNLDPKDARAVYKNTHYDMRRFKRLQLFTHLEELVNDTELKTGDISVFIRLGSDYKNNYYEYEIPLVPTPHGKYNQYNDNDRHTVWPHANMFDFPLDLLKRVKLNRNKEMKTNPQVTFITPYYEYDPDPSKRTNRITVVGNPSLSDVDVIMIGVRNNTRVNKSGEVWVNELRLTDFDEEGGWAAQGNMHLALSDLATIDFSGRKETSGFGGIEQSMMERRQDDFEMYNISTSVDLGRFIPEKAKVSIPFNFSYSKETVTPKYDPFDQDITLKESLNIASNKAEKDSIKNLAQERVTSKSLSFNNIRINIASKTPMPYDPANFTFGYASNITESSAPTVAYDKMEDYRALMTYSYSPIMKTWQPFKESKSKSGAAKFARTLAFNYLPSNISFNSLITRNYSETILRDIESYRLGADNSANDFLSWSQSFYWDRSFSLNWDFTRNLKFSFASGTRAEIEEPYLQVNKKVNRNDYEKWRDEVWKSIKNFGTPYSYNQTASLTYQLPFRNIPALNWITNSSINYNSGYNWDRGPAVDTLEIGNTISNQMTFEFNNRINLVNLYNKWGFLKKVNDRFDGRKSSSAANRREQQQRTQERERRKKNKYQQTITLSPDTTTTITHNLKTKNIEVVALSNKKKYKLRFKKKDDNSIIINNKDTATLVLNIYEKEPKEMAKIWREIAEYSARGLMSVRNLSINYSRRNETYIQGFRPMAGDMFGQRSVSGHGFAPGLGFAFGLDGGRDYINESLSRDWLVMNDVNINPAIYNESEKLDIRAQIEPIKGLKIELNAARERNERTELQYMFPGMPMTMGGSFSMTTISLASSFKSSKASNNYESSVFSKFLNNRQHIHQRLERQYKNTHYPSGGFMDEYPGLAGSAYDPSIGSVNPNSPDVLIPAFIAAYTGKDVNKVSLSAFPSLSAILPNWTLVYDGLGNIPFLKDKVRNLQITHAYQSFYQVGGYNSFTDWMGVNDDLGYIRDVLTGRPVPNSAYDISSVSINEAFNPLFGINGTLINNISINAQFNKARVLNLNTSSYQIVESLQNEWVIGTGYRFNEFNKVLGIGSKKDNDFNNALIVKLDLSRRSNQALIRKIEDNYTQATSGVTVFTIMFSADYTINKALTMRMFFDRVLNKPLISESSYPTTNTNFGFSLRYTIM